MDLATWIALAVMIALPFAGYSFLKSSGNDPDKNKNENKE